MSILALFSTKPFTPAATDVSVPLTERFHGRHVAYLNSGQCGYLLGIAKLTTSGPVIVDTVTSEQPLAAASVVEIGAAIKKKMKGALFGKLPVVICSTSEMEWFLPASIEIADQASFNKEIRTNPAKVFGRASIAAGISYQGLLSGNRAVVLGVNDGEIHKISNALSGSFEFVRRQIPHLALLNLMLADPRVQNEELIPLVVDQGYAVAVAAGHGILNEIFARRFHGVINGRALSTDEIKSIAGELKRVGSGKILLAASPCSGANNIEQILTDEGVSIENYRIGNLTNSELFVYASTIL